MKLTLLLEVHKRDATHGYLCAFVVQQGVKHGRNLLGKYKITSTTYARTRAVMELRKEFPGAKLDVEWDASGVQDR